MQKLTIQETRMLVGETVHAKWPKNP